MSMYKMNNKTKELTINSTLWDKPSEIVSLENVVYEKISVITEHNIKYKLKDHYLKYNTGGFWLSVNNLKGYFSIKDGIGYLKLLFNNEEQKSSYFKLLEKIIKLANLSTTNSLIKDGDKVRLNYDDLPVEKEFEINAITIVLKSIVEKNDIFYPQISLNYCSYDV